MRLMLRRAMMLLTVLIVLIVLPLWTAITTSNRRALLGLLWTRSLRAYIWRRLLAVRTIISSWRTLCLWLECSGHVLSLQVGILGHLQLTLMLEVDVILHLLILELILQI